MKACKYSEGASGSDAVPSFRELLLCAVPACLPYLTLAPGVRMDLQKLLFYGPGFMLDGEAAFLVCSWGGWLPCCPVWRGSSGVCPFMLQEP